MDLGNGFFKVQFCNMIYLDRVIKDGLWFINLTFLTIGMWEPKFQPTKAIFSIATIWICIPILSTKYYEPLVLENIGNKLGPLLKIDMATVNGGEGQVCLIL